ncbi:hypothetical protein [Lutibacter sp.]|uniref:hypothetical protein n=1 Tax=Lutibacter sp. TaxID=1925666 RepID=UPI002733072C|nr:hypothetical protein [Lutibacter sp.]MDP3313427.1 hypothetical protein [Lutibacter sp.]
MEASTLNTGSVNTYLKVVSNNIIQSVPFTVKNIYINTLMPGFNYTDNNGCLISPNKCILL